MSVDEGNRNNKEENPNTQKGNNIGIDEEKLHDLINAAISMLNSREYSLPDTNTNNNDEKNSSQQKPNIPLDEEKSHDEAGSNESNYYEEQPSQGSTNYEETSHNNSSYKDSSHSMDNIEIQQIQAHIKDELENIIKSLQPDDLRVIDKYAIHKSMTIEDYAQLHASFVDPRIVSLALSARPYLAKEGKANLVDLFLKALNAITLFQDLKKADFLKGL